MIAAKVRAPGTTTVEIALEPAINVINSMATLAACGMYTGLPSWVLETAARLPLDLRHDNDLVMGFFSYAVSPLSSWPRFEDYLLHLEAQDPASFRDNSITYFDPELVAWVIGSHEEILKSVDTYLAFWRSISKKYDEPEMDAELAKEAYALLLDPPALKGKIVQHVRAMWEKVLKSEWERALPELTEVVEAHRRRNYDGLTALEVVRQITGRDLSGVGWSRWAERLVFVPSPHEGPYIARLESRDELTQWVIFGQRMPHDTAESGALTRAELGIKLTALADDTRLKIIDLLAKHDELGAQDIIKMLDVSQPNASRHLRQLFATGFVTERRHEGAAKCYRLNRAEFEETIQSLRHFIEERT